MKWLVLLSAILIVLAFAFADGEIWEEDDREVLIRSERGAKNRGELLIFIELFRGSCFMG